MALIHISTLTNGLEIWTVSNPLPHPTTEAELVWDDNLTPATMLEFVYIPALYFQVIYVRSEPWSSITIRAADADADANASSLSIRPYPDANANTFYAQAIRTPTDQISHHVEKIYTLGSLYNVLKAN